MIDRRQFLAGLVAVPIVAIYIPITLAPEVIARFDSYRHTQVYELINELSDVDEVIDRLVQGLRDQDYTDIQTGMQSEQVWAKGKKLIS